MKRKPKLNLVLQLATICLCVCAIAIGVYSVKNANLSVTGTVNFTAHNCLVKVDVSMYGDAVGTDGNPSVTGTPRASTSARDLGTWDNSTSNSGTTLATVTGSTGEVKNQCYFSDMGTSGEVEDIVLEFKVTNNSDFPVTATIKDVTGDNYKFSNANGMNFSGDAIIASLPAKVSGANTSTATLQLKLNIKDTSVAPGSYTVSLYFERTKETSLTVQTGEFYYDANATAGQSKSYSLSDFTTNPVKAQRNYVTMGTYNGTDLKWYIFAQSDSKTGAMKAATDKIVEDGKELPKGTYWFISEYGLGEEMIYGGYPFDNNYKADYDNSSIKTYITDETATSGTLLSTYSISTDSDSVYSKIAKRLINDKESPNASEDKKGACVTKNAQKLWLLSVDELNILNGGNVEIDTERDSQSSNNHYKNILSIGLIPNANYDSLKQTLCPWWVRTPYYGDNSYEFTVSSDGNVYPYYVDDGHWDTVRPAFQITI